MKIFLVSLLIISIGVIGMCFNIISRKDGRFPDYEVGHNEEMKKLGIRCYKDIDADLHRSPRHSDCEGDYSEACEGCALYKKENL